MTHDMLSCLADAKWTFSTRRVDHGDIAGLDTNFGAARAGDLILAQVASLGQHHRVQLATGRPSLIPRGPTSWRVAAVSGGWYPEMNGSRLRPACCPSAV